MFLKIIKIKPFFCKRYRHNHRYGYDHGYTYGSHPTLQRGQAAIASVIFFVAVLLAITYGFSTLALQIEKVNRVFLSGKQSYFIAEAGQEDVVYRLMRGMNTDTEEVLSLGENSATTTQVSVSGNLTVTTKSDVKTHIRTVETELTTGTGVAFNYGMQAGEGGVFMENSSSVVGSVFSNGPIRGNGNSEIIKGDAISTGPAGLFDKLHATGTVYAHDIRETGGDTLIEGDAYYQNIDGGVTVLGAKYPGSADQPPQPLPITDEQITEWEAEAEAGGIISSPCPYKIEDTTVIGPVKITCDLEISKNNYNLDIAGHIWVTGDIIIKNSPTIRVHSSVQEGESVMLIADNPSDRLSSSKIDSDNSAVFEGNGEGSYVMLLSQNESAEQGGGETAIKATNSVSGDLLVYAGHGEIEMQNSISLKEVTAYHIHTKNTAEVIYESGLANLLFTSGPGGGYEILDWKEVE